MSLDPPDPLFLVQKLVIVIKLHPKGTTTLPMKNICSIYLQLQVGSLCNIGLQKQETPRRSTQWYSLWFYCVLERN